MVLMVPGPTVDRRVSVNSGAARTGATTTCHDERYRHRTREKFVTCLALTDRESDPRTAYVDPVPKVKASAYTASLGRQAA